MLSASAPHWLDPGSLARLYRDLGGLLRPGGLFLNGDHMAFSPALPTLAHLSEHQLDQQWTDDAFEVRGIEAAEQWWEAVARTPALTPLLSERTRRFAGKTRQACPPDFDAHLTALREAGFAEAGTIWQQLSSRVLLAVR